MFKCNFCCDFKYLEMEDKNDSRKLRLVPCNCSKIDNLVTAQELLSREFKLTEFQNCKIINKRNKIIEKPKRLAYVDN